MSTQQNNKYINIKNFIKEFLNFKVKYFNQENLQYQCCMHRWTGETTFLHDKTCVYITYNKKYTLPTISSDNLIGIEPPPPLISY